MAQLGPISESFVAFGSVAGISLASLNDIGAKSSSSYHSMTEVCDLWLQKCRQEQSPPTWHTVAEILEIIGHNKLSKKILQVYTTGNFMNRIYDFVLNYNIKDVTLAFFRRYFTF